ncbi:hypothetical protein BH20ACT24_BH20ACT24_06390 [soil metagenome]
MSGLTMIPLAAAALLVTNLAALRSRRHGTDELYGSLAARPHERTLGHLLSTAWAAGAGMVVIAVDMLSLLPFDPVGSPQALELLVGPLLVALAGCIGVLVARWWSSVVAGPVSLVALVAIALFFITSLPASSFDASSPDRFLLPWAPLSLEWSVAPELVLRPAGWHLAYLIGLILLIGGAALLRHGVRAWSLGVTTAALVLTVISAGAQLKGPTDEQVRALARLAEEPEAARVCEVRSSVRYCAYPAYAPWIDRWAAAVTPVIEAVPPRARPDGTEVVQRLPYYGGDLPRGVVLRLERDYESPRRNSIPMTTQWGRGSSEGEYELGLALVVARWSVGLPRSAKDVVLTEEDVANLRRVAPAPPGEDDGLAPGVQWGSCHLVGQSRAVIALWLAGRATAGSGATLRGVLGPAPYGYAFSEGETRSVPLSEGAILYELTNVDLYQPLGPYFQWGTAEAFHAVQLLGRSDEEVLALVRRHWDTLIDPATPTRELENLLGLPPMPSPEKQFRDAGLDPGIIADETGPASYLYDPPCR